MRIFACQSDVEYRDDMPVRSIEKCINPDVQPENFPVSDVSEFLKSFPIRKTFQKLSLMLNLFKTFYSHIPICFKIFQMSWKWRNFAYLSYLLLKNIKYFNDFTRVFNIVFNTKLKTSENVKYSINAGYLSHMYYYFSPDAPHKNKALHFFDFFDYFCDFGFKHRIAHNLLIHSL